MKPHSNRRLTRVLMAAVIPARGLVPGDIDSVGLQNTYSGALFLALNDGTYTATVGYLRLTYRW